jgi:hypothetical protein
MLLFINLINNSYSMQSSHQVSESKGIIDKIDNELKKEDGYGLEDKKYQEAFGLNFTMKKFMENLGCLVIPAILLRIVAVGSRIAAVDPSCDIIDDISTGKYISRYK